MRSPRGLALCALLAACDCGDDAGLGRVVPQIAIDPETLAFGEVPLGATRRLSLAVTNTGSADLELGAPDATAPFLIKGAPRKVAPGERIVLEVGFRPVNVEPQTGSLTFGTNVEDKPMVSVPLSGLGIEGSLTVRPPTIDLLNTTVGSERAAEIVLDNLGLGDVAGRIVVNGFARPEHYTLSTLARFDQAGAFALEGRTQSTLELRYRPLAEGSDEGIVTFEICGDRCGLEVEVSASASQAVVQLEPPALDFGDQGIGEARSRQIVVHNLGADPVEIRSAQISGGPEWVASPARGVPFTLTGGDSAAINIEFTPRSADQATAQVLIATSDPILPVARATLVGRGVGPRFEVVPNPISFGVERQNGTFRRAALMINSGSSEVRVQSLSVLGDPELSLGPLPGLPARLAAGESLSVEVLFTPSGIGAFVATLSVVTDDPASTLVEIPITAGRADQVCDILVSPERINFGFISPGFSRRRTTTITNVGGNDCNFLSGAFRAPVDPAFRIEGTPWPSVLTPGSSQTFDAVYAPTASMESKANLVLTTDDPVFPERHVSLLGSSIQDPRVFVQPTSIDFGQIRVGCSAENRSTVLFNVGSSQVTVDSVTLNGGPEITMAPIPPGFLLGSGLTLPISLGYAAVNTGVDTGEIEIVVHEVPYALVVPITGEGLINTQATDTFVQSRNDKVDLLFVIDNSCSMADDQGRLAANFGSFIRLATVRAVDFQIGVTTTTVVPIAGTLVGPILTPLTPALDQAFSDQVSVGINGSGIEQGLEGMSGALRLAAQGVEPNRSLFRPDSGLVVIFVSDEDDQSPVLPSVYFSELETLYAVNGYATAAVTGEVAGCFDPAGSSGDPAPAYLEFLRFTNGISESICDSWATTLASIGGAVFGLKTRFRLGSLADETAPIDVFVDGVPSAAGAWMYDAASHSIIFDTPPPENSTVTVMYTPTC